MVSVHPKARICYVADDGEGGAVLKMVGPAEGQLVEWPLDVTRAAMLARDLNAFIARKTAPPIGGDT